MKIRADFVTNSSSSSFIISNKTDKDLTLVDFVDENPQLIEEFKEQYRWYKDDPKYTQEMMLKCAEYRKEIFESKSTKEYIYGDEDGDILGAVFDYILRDGGQSESFEWEFGEYYR